MKIGAVGFGSRTAGVYNEFSKVNPKEFNSNEFIQPLLPSFTSSPIPQPGTTDSECEQKSGWQTNFKIYLAIIFS